MAEPVWTDRDDPGEHIHEPTALRAWHASHSTWLHGFLRRSLRIQPDEADDIVQDTWLQLIRTSLADVEHPRAFLSRIALNLFRDRRRHEGVRRSHHLLVLRGDCDRVDVRAITEQEASHELQRIVLDLPEHLRDVFLLSRFRRMTNREIAAHFGISVKTVEWRISKAVELCTGNLQG